MAKFIEIKQECSFGTFRRCEYTGELEMAREIVYEQTYINVDRIETIFPQGDRCEITLIGGKRITAMHSAIWVLAQINGQ
ncbi:MAG: hypothetical protein NC421_07405 [Lachnospiraceae bacterium]|nr:hypothetical protein [Lachnospiraceae bacterium]